MLEQFFTPQKIAVIGASKKPGKVGYELMENLLEGAFTGEIIPVNPKGGELFGLTILQNIKDYDGSIDQAILAIPKNQIIDALQDCFTKKCSSVILVGAGYKENGDDGAILEEEVLTLCRKNGVRLLGPNCIGYLNREISLNATFAGKLPRKGKISFFSQSGALSTAILDQTEQRGLGISKMISIGNKADINENDLLSYFAKDENTNIVAGYLENIVSGNTFVKNAATISARKPVIILKAGTTDAGQRAATSHTGAFTGTDTAYGAAFKRAGVIRAESFDALFDYTTAFSLQPLPKGNRVLVISNAGGTGTITADAVELAGLALSEPPTNRTGSLRGKKPAFSDYDNPVQVLGDAPKEIYVEAVRDGLSDSTVDGIIIVLTPAAMSESTNTLLEIAKIQDSSKPILCCLMGGIHQLPPRFELVDAGLAIFPTPGRTVAAFQAMSDYAEWRSLPPRVVTRFRVNRRRAGRVIQRSQSSGRLRLGEVKAKKILEAYGFNVPRGQLVNSSDEAVEYARRIGFPVALKVASPDIVHKSDMGGVRLNLANASQVQDGYDLMQLRIRQQVPNARIDGIYVEKMADPGLEVIIGMNRDPQFGPMLMFGLGGIFVEVMKDVTFHLAPITQEEAVQMLQSTRSYDILEGRRGNKGVDIVAIATGLQRISQLATDYPQILELDINPFIVGEEGSEPIVADARITLESQDDTV